MANVLAKKWGGHGRPCRPYAAAYENTGFLANDNTTQILTQQQGFSHQGRKLTTVPEMMLKCSLTLSMCKGGREQRNIAVIMTVIQTVKTKPPPSFFTSTEAISKAHCTKEHHQAHTDNRGPLIKVHFWSGVRDW